MSIDTIGILSILENKPYKEVKKLWKLFEKKYNSTGVRTFNHPNVTFQGGKTYNIKQLKNDFNGIISKIKPYEINVSEIGHFNKEVVYLKVKNSNNLLKINRLINKFLKNYCKELFEYCIPKNWVPHITLAMDDLTNENFEKAWHELNNINIEFKQTLHNICIVRLYPDRKIRIVKKFELL